MRERIFNIFLYIGDNDLIESLGAIVHNRSGSDADKMAFLQRKVNDDHKLARRFPLPQWCVTVLNGHKMTGRLTYQGFQALQEKTRSVIIDGNAWKP